MQIDVTTIPTAELAALAAAALFELGNRFPGNRYAWRMAGADARSQYKLSVYEAEKAAAREARRARA